MVRYSKKFNQVIIREKVARWCSDVQFDHPIFETHDLGH